MVARDRDERKRGERRYEDGEKMAMRNAAVRSYGNERMLMTRTNAYRSASISGDHPPQNWFGSARRIVRLYCRIIK